jgi:hypothetical protein
MAHLLEIGGEAELVASIARRRNNARVRELADEPRLLAWLAAAGLTVAEAAAIQPSYCSTRSDCVCGGDFAFTGYPVPAKGVIEAVVSDGGWARVVTTYGETPGVTTGDQIRLTVYSGGGVPGARVLAPVGSEPPSQRADGGAPVYPAIALAADGTYSCNSGRIADTPKLTARQFVDAVTAPDCAKTLASYDRSWAQSFGCEGMGCALGKGEAVGPTSLGILLAIVAALAFRRK